MPRIPIWNKCRYLTQYLGRFMGNQGLWTPTLYWVCHLMVLTHLPFSGTSFSTYFCIKKNCLLICLIECNHLIPLRFFCDRWDFDANGLPQSYPLRKLYDLFIDKNTFYINKSFVRFAPTENILMSFMYFWLNRFVERKEIMKSSQKLF